MNLSTISLNLAAIKPPTPSVEKAKGWVLWGKNHGFQKEVLGYINGSPTASAMLGRKCAFIAGEGWVVDKETYPQLAEWLKNVAPEGKRKLTGNQLLKRLSKDAGKLEGVAFQVAWAKDGKTIAGLKHQRIETVAPSLLNEEDEIEGYWICRDWSKQTEYPPKYLPRFNPAKATGEPIQLYVYREEEPGEEYFQLLSYLSALSYMSAEARLATFHDNNIQARFALNLIVKIRRGPKDIVKEDGTTITAEAQRLQWQEAFKKTYKGESADSVIFLWGDPDSTDEDASGMAEFETITTTPGETYEAVAKICAQAILSAGQVTSPQVVGLPREGGLGGSEIREAYEIYLNTVCRGWQMTFIEIFKELAEYAPGVGALEDDSDNPALEIITTLPVKMHFSEDTLAGTLDDDEIRSNEDWGPRKKAVEAEEGEVIQTEAQKALAGSVGGQSSIDAMLTLLSQKLTTRESCISRLKVFYGMTAEQAESIVPLPNEQAQLPAVV
jgi:hypothetical protein